MAQSSPLVRALQQAVDCGIFPGAVLLVRVQGVVRCHEAVGRLGHHPYDRPVHPHTIYDLASLTKPLVTATALLCLIEDGKVALDQPVGSILSEIADSSLGSVTIRQLLAHRAGLPAWKPYYQMLFSPHDLRLNRDRQNERLLCFMKKEALLHPKSSTGVYSDLGFMLLGLVIERCGQQPLAVYCRDHIFQPAEAAPLFFIDVGNVSPHRDQIAPTEDDPWRGRVLQGEVHDENAYALGGIAGHAGLFGTAVAVGQLSRLWLKAVCGQESFLSSSLAKEFVKKQDETGKASWGLGWDTPSRPSSSGQWFSPQSFGHLGFTGTSLWIDPVCELEVIFLSNRVHPTRDNTQIQSLRPALHDLVYQEYVGLGKR
ncbi:MAG: serine hydrolase [Nitrospirales bacterium]|nr:serine hydrolase [Nitrospirales bacterium]